MSADAALVYLRRFGVLVGRRIAIATNNDSAYPVAEALGRSRGGGRDFRHAGGPARDEAQGLARRRAGRRGRRGGRRGRPGRRPDPRRRHAAAFRRLDADRPSLRPGARQAALRRGARRPGPEHGGRRGDGRRRRQRRLHARRSFAPGPRGGRRREAPRRTRRPDSTASPPPGRSPTRRAGAGSTSRAT